MTRAMYAAVGAAVLGSCTVPPVDLATKGCPCLSEYSCNTQAKSCFIPPPGDPKTGCVVHTDGRLWCSNRESPLFATASTTSTQVSTLKSTFSYFVCWSEGDPYSKGGGTATSWYYTEGDNPGLDMGWLPGTAVDTPLAFDTSPGDFGFDHFPACH